MFCVSIIKPLSVQAGTDRGPLNCRMLFADEAHIQYSLFEASRIVKAQAQSVNNLRLEMDQVSTRFKIPLMSHFVSETRAVQVQMNFMRNLSLVDRTRLEAFVDYNLSVVTQTQKLLTNLRLNSVLLDIVQAMESYHSPDSSRLLKKIYEMNLKISLNTQTPADMAELKKTQDQYEVSLFQDRINIMQMLSKLNLTIREYARVSGQLSIVITRIQKISNLMREETMTKQQTEKHRSMIENSRRFDLARLKNLILATRTEISPLGFAKRGDVDAFKARINEHLLIKLQSFWNHYYLVISPVQRKELIAFTIAELSQMKEFDSYHRLILVFENIKSLVFTAMMAEDPKKSLAAYENLHELLPELTRKAAFFNSSEYNRFLAGFVKY